GDVLLNHEIFHFAVELKAGVGIIVEKIAAHENVLGDGGQGVIGQIDPVLPSTTECIVQHAIFNREVEREFGVNPPFTSRGFHMPYNHIGNDSDVHTGRVRP